MGISRREASFAGGSCCTTDGRDGHNFCVVAQGLPKKGVSRFVPCVISMSNCHVVAGRSLIDLVASRLALRAPALRAAMALTQPNQSAQWLPCGRHTVPTGKMV